MRSFLYVLKLWAYRHCVATQVVLVSNIVNGSLDKSDFTDQLGFPWPLGHSKNFFVTNYKLKLVEKESKNKIK